MKVLLLSGQLQQLPVLSKRGNGYQTSLCCTFHCKPIDANQINPAYREITRKDY